MGVLKPFSKWLAIAVLETGKPLKTVSALWYPRRAVHPRALEDAQAKKGGEEDSDEDQNAVIHQRGLQWTGLLLQPRAADIETASGVSSQMMS